MKPARPSYLTGADQFNQLYQGLQGCKVNAASIWLQVSQQKFTNATITLKKCTNIPGHLSSGMGAIRTKEHWLHWSSSQSGCCKYRSFFGYMLLFTLLSKKYHVAVGIYTSQEEWMKITNDVRELILPTRLWSVSHILASSQSWERSTLHSLQVLESKWSRASRHNSDELQRLPRFWPLGIASGQTVRTRNIRLRTHCKHVWSFHYIRHSAY